jgi:hypothetical protein
MLGERDLQALEAFMVMSAVGLPWQAVLEGARVYDDTLRRLAETDVRLVHVHIHERLEASGVPDEEISRQIGALTDAVVPLLDGLVQWVHHQHLLQAEIEDAYLHLPSDAVREQGTVETTILFLDVASFAELTQTKGDRPRCTSWPGWRRPSRGLGSRRQACQADRRRPDARVPPPQRRSRLRPRRRRGLRS